MSDKKLPHNHGQAIEHHFDHMPKTEEFSAIADIFKLLGDSSRIRIFWLLCHCEECVTNISVMMDMTSPAVSHHLKLLRANNLITSRRDGKEVYYKAADTELAETLHRGIERLVKITCPGQYR